MRKAAVLTVLASVLVSFCPAQACTDIVLTKSPGLVISGRTMDFDSDLGSKVCFRAKGSQITDPGRRFTRMEYQPLTWTSKYNSVLVDAFDQPAFADGMNSEGLSVACLWQDDTEPANTVQPGTIGMSNVGVLEYVVENAKSVDEAERLFKGLTLAQADFKGMRVTLHWIVTDNSGKSVVVELKDGRPMFFDQVSKVGVLTNAPSYDRQLANLQKNQEKAKTETGYVVPGDYRAPDRFVRSAFLVSKLPAPKNANDAMTSALQILHNVDVPKGAQDSYTQWIVVRDQTNLRYWLVSASNPVPKMFDLRELDFQRAQAMRIPVDGTADVEVPKLSQLPNAVGITENTIR